MRYGNLFAILASAFYVCTFFSCTDERYNLDNISDDVHLFENGVSFPLLRTGDLNFNNLISSQNDIRLNEEGIYEFYSNEEHFKTHIDKVPKIKISEQNPDFGTIKSFTTQLVGINQTISIPLPSDITTYSATINIKSDKLDDRVIETYAAFIHSDWVSEISLSVVDGNENPLSGGVSVKTMSFDNYKLSFPEILLIDGVCNIPNGIRCSLSPDNTITLNGEVNDDVLKFGIKIKGVDSGDKNLINSEQKVVINEKVDLSGNITLGVYSPSSSSAQTFKVKPTLHIPEAIVDEARGKMKLDVEIMKEEIKIGSLPSFIKGDGTSLKLSNPYLPLYVTSTVPMGVMASIKLYPKDENGKYIYKDGEKIVVSVDELSIPGDDHSDNVPTNFYEYVACESINYYDENGFEFVECLNLEKLCSEIPASIEIVAEGQSDANDVQEFYFDEEFDIDILYRAHIPFSLNAGSMIQYNESTTDLNEDISDILESISSNSIFIKALIKNDFLANMSLDLEIFDKSGNRLDGNGIDLVIPDNTIYAKDVTNIRIEFRESLKNKLKLIDRIDWKVNVLFPEKANIKKEHFLNMKINLELPNGIGLDFDNL